MTVDTAAAWAILIAAVAAGIGSIVTVVQQGRTARKVGEVHAAVSTSNDETLGQVLESTARAVGVDVGEHDTPPA